MHIQDPKNDFVKKAGWTEFNLLMHKNIFLNENFTHLMPLAFFYTPWKHQKTSSYLLFSEHVEKDSDIKWG